MTGATQTVGSEHDQAPRRGPAWWVVAVVAVIATVLGLGVGYLVSSQTSDVEQSNVSAEEVDRVVALLDAYETAWNANDADAVLDVFSEDFVLAEGYTVETTGPALRRDLARTADQGLSWEYVGDPVVVRLPSTVAVHGTYNVSAPWVASYHTTEELLYGITVYRVIDDDGVLKIRRAAPDDTWFRY